MKLGSEERPEQCRLGQKAGSLVMILFLRAKDASRWLRRKHET